MWKCYCKYACNKEWGQNHWLATDQAGSYIHKCLAVSQNTKHSVTFIIKIQASYWTFASFYRIQNSAF